MTATRLRRLSFESPMRRVLPPRTRFGRRFAGWIAAGGFRSMAEVAQCVPLSRDYLIKVRRGAVKPKGLALLALEDLLRQDPRAVRAAAQTPRRKGGVA